MKKIIILFIFGLFSLSNNANSAWYGNHPVNYTNPGGTVLTTINGGGPNKGTWCTSDGDTTGGSPSFPSSGVRDYAVALNNNSVTLNPHGDNELNIASSGTMRCLYWDGQIPESLSVTYTSGWTNSSKIITVEAKDRGGSKLKKMILQESTNLGSWNNVANWDNLIDANNTLVTRTWNRVLVNGSNFKYRLITYDYAGNTNNLTNNNLIYFDDVAPVAGDITSSRADYSYIPAENGLIFTINGAAAGGSPIAIIEGQFENDINETLFNSTKNSTLDEDPGDGSKLTTLENISSVDDFYVIGKKYRQYTYKITKACDEAGNCVASPPTFNYYVHSNKVDPIKSTITGTDGFNDEFANGNTRTLTINLRDYYNNPVVKVIKADGLTVLKTVNLQVGYTNSLYLNQYNKSGDGLINNKFAMIIGDGTGTLTDADDSGNNGTYPIDFMVYAPTENAYIHAIGEFKITKMIGTLSGWLPVDMNITPIDFKFKPLLETNIDSQIRTHGFLEGTTQTGTISFSRFTGYGSTPVNRKLFLEYGSGAREISPKLEMRVNSAVTPLGEGLINNTPSTNPPFKNALGNNMTFNTLLTQTGGTLDTISNQYLSTHISYTIGTPSKTVVYNSDILGKDDYWGSSYGIGTTQVGLKVLGKTHSEDAKEIITNQDEKDIHVLGNIEKSLLKGDIRKKAYEMIKFSKDTIETDPEINDVNNLSSNDLILLNDDVLYIGDLAGNTNVIMDSSGTTISGKKTIIIKGRNLYIKSNVINNSSSDILGIIVMKNPEGKGGNIYIHPGVTRIDGILYADKSLISYNGSELDGSTNQYTLRNQLYINGSVFSENTIGGARETPPICPYYIDTTTCNSPNIAQKYDLNFLRRYFTTGATIINGGISNFILPSDYFKYPVVIKYNPLIQTSPPPLFGK